MFRGSCNGLLLVLTPLKTLWLWNPSTRKRNMLPLFPGCCKYCLNLGFDYDSSNNDYKVVHIQSCGCIYYHQQYCGLANCIRSKRKACSYKPQCYKDQIWVFSLASNTWRKLPFPPSIPIETIREKTLWNAALVDGALHWLTSYLSRYEGNKLARIVTFDISTEKLVVDLIPAFQFPDHVEVEDSHLSLEVLQGRLVFCHRISEHHIGLSYAAKHGQWTKLYNLDLSSRLTWDKDFKIFDNSNDGNKILLQFSEGFLGSRNFIYYGYFYWYDIKQRSLELVEIGPVPLKKCYTTSNFDKSSFCWETLVSPFPQSSDRVIM
ncbi:hypothetical protein COLO4_10000 [Corchorus olitorius]|uniref:F-box associated beta-propeller type 1 domain-containing protein n=1 Tax=Corchorus olitorius TaxID=93759 RepID=A0A1R3KAI9_9ROSI|nr:hypothetical protein COLO4_10000 [Corchorus olitorius]